MAETQDMTKMVKDMMNAFPMDMSAMQGGWKNYAAFGEKMSRVALDAAHKSTEISARWTQDTLSKMGSVATVKDEPQDYSKAVTDFASSQAEMTAETMAAFAEIAKKVQMDTVELMLAAGRDASEDITAAARKTQGDMTAATQKAADQITSATQRTADQIASATQRTADQTTTANQRTADQMSENARKLGMK